MTNQELKAFIIISVMRRFAHGTERREEALRDVLRLVSGHMQDSEVNELAAKAPKLPDSLYEKWVGLFADRLLETVPQEQILDLCRDNEESEATLTLVFVMFMESERMEKVVAEDIRTFQN